MTIKINEYKYSKEKLEQIMNKKWETLVWLMNWLIITKTTIKTSRQIVAKTNTQKFFDIFINKIPDNEILSIISKELNIDIQENKQEILKFANFRLERWENDIKYKWEKQNTFEYLSRLRTWFSNKRDIKPKKWTWITKL